MKRAPELRDLSADHHHGLALARKSREAAAADEGPTDHVWADIGERFKTELEPHFQIEESLIAPILKGRGESGLAGRLNEEHEALRSFLIPGADRTPAGLRQFAELLEKHIRWEEREFFEVAQKVLRPEELQAVANATRAAGAKPARGGRK